ncbi:MAG TPA: DHA2 family efflux MFS transporter permease subunit [Polyangia bacterium]|nr:DHA2 family efflux MFS transporter permease subunit [Polyangia bacterium]
MSTATVTAFPAAVAARAPVNKWIVTLSVTFGTLMGAIDTSIVAVATPHLTGALGATVPEMTWVTTGFVIATVVVMPLTAFLGRFFGQKRVYLFSLGLFVLGSALCGLARSLPMMVACRALQGLGAGALQPTEQAILRQTFPPEEQGMAMALFGLAVVVGPAAGPALGGYLLDNYNWPWIFYINLPIGLLGIFMVSRFVHEPEDIRRENHARAEVQRKNLDWIGIVLMTVGLAALQYVLEEGSSHDWFESRLIAVTAFVAVFVLAAFVIRELTAPVPAVDLSLFKDRVFLSGTLIGAMMFAILMSITFLLPLFMQQLLGFTALQSGEALMPRALAMMVGIPLVGRLYNRVQPRILIIIGVLLVALSAYLMSHYTLETGARSVVGAIVIQGLGFAAIFVPLTTVALAGIPRYRLTDATGLNSLLRQIGGSLGLAAFATLLPHFIASARSGLAAHAYLGRPEMMARLGGLQAGLAARGVDPAGARVGAARIVDGMLMQQASVLAFERMFITAGVAFLIVIPLALWLRKPQTAPNQSAKLEDLH